MMAFGAKIKLSVNTSGASAFRSEIQKYVNTATASNPIKLKNFSVSMTKEQQKKIVRDIQTYLSGDTTLTLKIGKIDATDAVNKLRQQLQTMLSGLSITGLKEFLGETNIDKITQDIDKAKQSASQWAAQMRVIDDIQKRLGSTYRSALSGSQMVGDATQVQQITAAYTAWQVKVEKLRNTKVALSAEELQALQQEGIALQQKITLIQEEQAATAQAATEAERAAAQEEIAARKELALAQQQVSLKSQVQRYIMSNSKAYKVYGAELDGIMHRLQNESSLTDEQLKQIRMRFYEIQTSAKAAGMSGNTFFDTMKKGFAKFGGWSLITRTLMAVYRIFTNMITAVKELDAAMTELKKVTDLSERSYREYLVTAQQLSKEIGATLADTVNATADFARLGYSIADSTALAEAALVYKNVGDGIEDIGTASESLISTIKAFEQFGESANNAMSIIDRFNEVGNNFAISSEGIGSALQRSASSLAAAGNTLNQSIALVTGMNAVVQDPEKVGTALKTISMYLRAAKTEAEEAGESTEGMANSVSELRSELLTLTKGKVDIMLDDKTFKSTYEIMKDLSKVWNDLANIDQANILELIGGKRNANAVTSLLTNFEDAEKALQTAAQASGSALAENEKYLDSIAGKLSVFQSKFETFSTNLIDSGVVKFVVDLGSVLLTILDTLNRIHLLLPLIAVTTAVVMGHMNANKMTMLVQQILLQKNAIIAEKAASDQLAVSLAGLTAQQRKLLIAELDRAVASGTLTATERAQIMSTLGLAGAEGTLTVANKGLAASFKTLMASIPIWGWIALGISLILELATAIGDMISNIETSEEKIARLNDEMKETVANIKNISTEYRNLKSSADEVIPRFVQLAKGVDDFGRNVSLTDEEYAEFLSLNNQIAEMFPELNLGMDSNGNAMLSLSYSANTLSDSLWELVEAQRAAANKQIADEELPDLIEKATDIQNEYNQQIDAYAEKIKLIQGLTPDGMAGFLNTDVDTINTYSDFLSDYGIKNEYHYTPDYSYTDPTTGYSTYQTGYSWYQLMEEDEEKFNDAVNQFVKNQEKLINDAKEKINKQWQSIMPAINSWMQTEENFNSLGNELQTIVSKMLSNVNLADLKIEGTEDMKSQIKEWLIDPIAEATPEAQAAVEKLFGTMTAFNSGDMTFSQYKMAVDGLIADLREAGFSNKFINTLTLTLNIDDLYNKANTVKGLLKDEYKDAVDDFSAEEIELAYKVQAADGSLTLEELKQEILELGNVGAEMIEVLDFSSMTDAFDDITSGLNNITSAMEKLRGGTALTKGEIAKLALQYPELLKNANLFQDSTIEGQNKVLQNLLDNYEAEYDATIDTKIAELKASNKCLEAQVELENKKLDVVLEIKEAEAKGKIESEEWLLDKVADFNDLQGRNYVSMENGILTVNENALNEQMKSANEAAKENTDAWGQSASDVTSFYNASATASVEATNKAQEKIRTKINGIGEWFQALWETICRLFTEGKWEWGILEEVYDDPTINVTLNPELSGNYNYNSIDNKTIDEWVSDQEDAINSRLDDIDLQYNANLNIISNLESLKGLDLTSIYGSSTKKIDENGNVVEEYIAIIDRFYAAQKKLEAVQAKRDDVEKELDHTDDVDTKIKLYEKLIGIYNEEIRAEQNLVSQRTSAIYENIVALEALGFEVEYNAETNQLYIKNLEHINDLTASSKGEYKTLQEATNALREETEALIKDTEDLCDANQDSSDSIEDLTYDIQDANEAIDELKNGIEEYLVELDRFYKAQKKLDAISEEREDIEKELSHTDDVDEEIKLREKLIGVYKKEIAAEQDLVFQRNSAIYENIAALEALGFEVEYNAKTGQLYIKNLEHINDLTAKSKGEYDTLDEATNALREDTESLIEDTESLCDANHDSIDSIEDMTYSIQDETEAIDELKNGIEEYLVELDRFYKAQKKLDAISEEREDIEKELSHTDDVDEKIKLHEKLIDIYKKEIRAEQNLVSQRTSAIYENIVALEALGFEVEYNAETNQLYIKNLEHINDLTASSKGEYKTLQEATNALREETEALIKDTEDLCDANQDSSDSIEDLTYDIQDAAEEIVGYIEDVYKAQIESYNEIIKKRKEAIESAKEEYDYESDVADKVKEIADLQARIDKLSLDNSREAQAEKAALEEELADKQKSLADTQNDHAHDESIEALDKMGEKYEEEKNSELEIIKNSIGTVQDLGSTIDERVTNAWKNAKKAVDEYGKSVAVLNGGVVTNVDTVPKYHTGGVVGGNATGKEEILALLEAGEIVLNDQKQDTVYRIIDFQTKLAERLGVDLGRTTMPLTTLDAIPNFGGVNPGVVNTSTQTVFNPEFNIEISHNGEMSDDDARRYGEEIAETAIAKLYNAFERKGISNHNGAKLRP